MKVIVFFVEITEYNIARIQNVYEKMDGVEFTYVYCSATVTGHETDRKLPENAEVLSGSVASKIARVKNLFRQNQFDFAVINGYSDAVRGTAIWLAKQYGIPYAIETDTQLHIPTSPIKRTAKRMLLRWAFSGKAHGFAGGSRQRQLFYHYGMTPDRVHVLPMTVDVVHLRMQCSKLPDKNSIKKEKGFEGKKIALYVGRFEKEKNLQMLLQVFKRVCKQRHDAVLLLVGKGSQKCVMQGYIEQNDLGNSIHIFEYMLPEQLVAFYKMADVLVLPSRYEPWGLVVNEALACELPVLASDRVGASDDLIVPGENGDTFAWDDEDELALKLDCWLTKGSLQPEVGSVMDVWNHETYRSVFTKVIMEIMDENCK